MAKKRLRRKIMLICFIGIVLLCAFAGFIVTMDMHNVSQDFMMQKYDSSIHDNSSKLNFAKAYDIQKQKQETEDRNSSGVGGNSVNPGAVGETIAGFPLEYFCFFPVYEAGSDVFDVNKSDGGFGPIQETHSGLAITIDKMYDLDPDYWSVLKPFVDDPSTYMYRCDGGDHANHTWPNRYKDGQGGKTSTKGCVSYNEGSQKLVSAFQPLVSTPEGMYKFYNDFIEAEGKRYFEAAVKDCEEKLGVDYVKPGTIGLISAAYVRWDVVTGRSNIWPGITHGMDEATAITMMMNNCYNASGGASRWKDCRQLIDSFNDGIGDIYGKLTCDRSCGSLHGGTYTFGQLFGKE